MISIGKEAKSDRPTNFLRLIRVFLDAISANEMLLLSIII